MSSKLEKLSILLLSNPPLTSLPLFPKQKEIEEDNQLNSFKY